MALAAVAEPTEHSGVYLQTKPPSAHVFWAEIKDKTHGLFEVPDHIREYYDKHASGGTRSNGDRTVKIHLEASDETIAIGAKVSTKVLEVKELLASWLQADVGKIEVKRKTATGGVIQKDHEEVASFAIVTGIRGLKRKKQEYSHPLLIIGAGLGGIQTMIDMQANGRKDFICVEKHADFGGHSWISVANKFTKLQTEKGTYHVNYIFPWAPVPHVIGGMPYKTWPNRDELLYMFRENSREHNLYEKATFNTSVERVTPQKNGAYAVHYVPEREEDGDGGVLMVGAVIAWPGNLTVFNTLDFPGEDEFGGYIEYSSFDKVDYTQCERKTVILYGHGAFTIENVRTLVEHRCKKVVVVCRRRNLAGMKMCSWMVGQAEIPVPGTIVLEVFQKMYDLVGFDVWTAHSVRTDSARSFAQISQKTVFGVTDVYFLAGYYDLMEIVVDEIKRLSYMCAHTKKMRKIDCEVIIKAIGTSPSFKIDKCLGIKELVGIWINGDPLRPVCCNGMFVEARNFGSFSSGPGFAPSVKIINWFIDHPEDWQLVAQALPHNKASDRPAYVPGATYFLPMNMVLLNGVPGLNQETSVIDALKARKQQEAHPLREFLAECKAEWEGYIKHFKDANMVDDRPEPPYPYTEEMMREFMDRGNRLAFSQAQARGRV